MKEGIQNKDRFAKRIRTKRLLMIAFLSLFLTPCSLIVSQNTPEQEQQFSYYWYAARNAIDSERYPEAYALLQFCHALKPDDAQTLYYLGIMYQGMGKKAETVAAYEEAYRVQKKGARSEELLERLLQVYLATEQWKPALKIQDEIDAQRGYDAYSAITRYRIYAMAGEYKKAIKEIDRYLKTDPDNLRFLLFKLELMEQTGAKPKNLIAMYKKILAMDPYNLMVLNNYAYYIATHGGDLNEAEKMSAITIREDANNPVYLDTYGWILHLKGKNDLALFYLQRALSNSRDERMKAEVEGHLKKVESLKLKDERL